MHLLFPLTFLSFFHHGPTFKGTFEGISCVQPTTGPYQSALGCKWVKSERNFLDHLIYESLEIRVRADRTTESIELATKLPSWYQSLICQSNERQTSIKSKKSKSKVSFCSKAMVKKDGKFPRDNSS